VIRHCQKQRSEITYPFISSAFGNTLWKGFWILSYSCKYRCIQIWVCKNWPLEYNFFLPGCQYSIACLLDWHCYCFDGMFFFKKLILFLSKYCHAWYIQSKVGPCLDCTSTVPFGGREHNSSESIKQIMLDDWQYCSLMHLKLDIRKAETLPMCYT